MTMLGNKFKTVEFPVSFKMFDKTRDKFKTIYYSHIILFCGIIVVHKVSDN